MHQCENSLCLIEEHYKIGSQTENMLDKRRDGTSNIGEANPMATITLETAQQIADSWKEKSDENYLTRKQRAILFNVSVSLIKTLDSRCVWPEVNHPNKIPYLPRPKRPKVSDLIMTLRGFLRSLKNLVFYNKLNLTKKT